MTNRMRAIVFGMLCFLAGAMFVTLMGTGKAPGVPSGRYQVSALGNGIGAFVLDTQTGHLWCRVARTWGDWESENLGKIPEYGVWPFEEIVREAQSAPKSEAKE